MDYFERNTETSLLIQKRDLKLEDIIVKDFEHVKRIWE